MDIISFCSDLIKCKSVTPDDNGAIDYIEKFLSSIGFETKTLIFQSEDGFNTVKNLFANYGNSKNKILGFIGHSDVVVAGDGWEVEPFSAIQKDGFLIGRGIADMKGGISAFCYAVSKFLEKEFDGSIKIFITGDEEVGTYEGMQSLIKWAYENEHIPQDCLIGEPSSEVNLGDRVYLGHRGSLNVKVKSHGKQGHSAYPKNYKNSLSSLCKYIAKMCDYKWEHASKKFPPTNLEPTMLFTNNYATNVIPDESYANLNIRFGDDYTSEKLKNILLKEAESLELSLDFILSGEAYYCDNDRLKNILSSAIKEITGIDTTFSAAGGTSDGRYMARHCNIIEFGLQDATIHQKNEKAKISDLKNLEKIYLAFLNKYFNFK